MDTIILGVIFMRILRPKYSSCTVHVAEMSIADVLGLLVTGDSSTSENGRILAGSILRSRESLDTEVRRGIKVTNMV